MPEIGLRVRPATAADRAFVLALADRLASFEVPAWRSKGELIGSEDEAMDRMRT